MSSRSTVAKLVASRKKPKQKALQVTHICGHLLQAAA